MDETKPLVPVSADEPRFGPAVAFAPLAAPVAVFAVAASRGLLGWTAASAPAAQTHGPYSLAAVVVWLFIIIAFGAPPAYVATLLIVWPSSRALATRGWFRWHAVATVSVIAGGLLMPLYLHLLAPRGYIDLFPAAGVVAGAATGLAFWFIATRWPRGNRGS